MDFPEERAGRLREESKSTTEELIELLPKCRAVIEQQWHDGVKQAQLTQNPWVDHFPGGFDLVKRELVDWLEEVYGADSIRVSTSYDDRTPRHILYIEKL